MSNQYLQYQPLFESLGCEVAADEPMKNHTTFKIGGSADLFVTVCDNSQLVSVVRLCNEKEIPLFVLGNGSNLLVSDKGIRGAVLRLGGEFCDIGFNSDGSVHCGAGAQLSKLCAFALEHSLTGLEFAWGIPGSCGGAAFMDAGAYGGEMKDVVTSCAERGKRIQAACRLLCRRSYRAVRTERRSGRRRDGQSEARRVYCERRRRYV